MLQADLRRDWPGAYALTDSGRLVYVPAPLDARGEHLLFYGFDAPKAALAFVPRGGVAIDIGANLGEWSVPLAEALGESGRLFCCEPNPPIAAALAMTLRINNFAAARVLTVGISAGDGSGRLIVDAKDTGQSRIGSGSEGIAVALRSVDSLVAEHRLDRLDFLKIDVEGHERQVFAGAGATLRRFRPAIVFESGHERANDRSAIAAMLADAGYETVAVLHHYGALPCGDQDYAAATGACAGTEARNILALPRDHSLTSR
jgi:FkbM family methyltransferase